MFFSNALASDAVTSATTGGLPALLSNAAPFIMMLAVFYFLLIRPNQKKLREHEDMVKSLRRGDKVVTAGGVIGVVSKVEDDNIVVLEIANEVKIRVIRDTISNVLTKSIANDNKADGKTAEKSGSK
jgi:preprotein translocase subunit YajC